VERREADDAVKSRQIDYESDPSRSMLNV
jgi:hypothetical protein